MKARSVVWGVFVLACLAQLAFASSAMWRGETTLRGGTLYHFRSDPVDPVDPFRGRYVALAFARTRVPRAEGADLDVGATAYVELAVDDEGMARLERAQAAAPAADHLALPVLATDATAVFVQLPFERYYAEEERALEIDRQRWQAGARFVVGVRVLDGRGVIESLRLGGSPTPLEADQILRPDPEAPLPEGLFEAIRAALPLAEREGCRSRGCVLFEVDLDREAGQEFVFVHPMGALSYWVGTGPGWRWAGRLVTANHERVEPKALLEALRATGAESAEPALRDLRVGDRTWSLRR